MLFRSWCLRGCLYWEDADRQGRTECFCEKARPREGARWGVSQPFSGQGHGQSCHWISSPKTVSYTLQGLNAGEHSYQASQASAPQACRGNTERGAWGLQGERGHREEVDNSSLTSEYGLLTPRLLQ